MGYGSGTPAPPPTSPWYWEAADYQGNVLSISVAFNTSTLVLLGATVSRDPDCVYSHIYLGVGADGTPDTSTHAFTVQVGTTNISAAVLARQGLNTLDDVTSLQITGGS